MATDRQFARDDRLFRVHFGLKRLRHGPDYPFCSGGRHLAGRRDAVAESLDEQLSVRIEHDLDDSCVVQRDAKLIAERLLKFADKPGMRAKLVHGCLLSYLAERGEFRTVIGGTEPHKSLRVGGECACDRHRHADLLRLA